MRIVPGLLGLALASLLAACGSGGDGGPPSDPPVEQDLSGMLRKARNADELAASIRAGIKAPLPPPPPLFNGAVDVAASGGSASLAFSGTYTVEAEVDELDTVRYDGQHLFVAPERIAHCCVVFEPAAFVPGHPRPAPVERSIRILRTDPIAGTATPVGSIPLGGVDSVQGLYVAGARVFALTTQNFWGEYGPFWTSVSRWNSEFGVQVFDVSNPAQPATLFTATLDGVYVASRRVGDHVYVVSRHSPDILTQPDAVQRVDSLPLNDLLPKARVNGVERALIDPRNCYLTNTGSEAGYPLLTTITVFPVSDPSRFTSVCYNESTDGIYMSEQALYVTDMTTVYGVLMQTQTHSTRIHRFALNGGAPTYTGSIELPGRLWGSAQPDFRLSEFNGLLRAVLTQQTSDASDRFDHTLHVVRQRTDALALEDVAQLPNARRPEEIGKPDEDLYAVRFFGNRAYAVSFRRIDPLYTIDLSTVTDPRIAGELEIPGFSQFLHPVNDDLLLGIGQTGDWRVKLELFDVSVFASPVSRSAIELGSGPGAVSWSDAVHNHHTFTWAPGADVDRFAIPAVVQTVDEASYVNESGLRLFEIHNKRSPHNAELRAVGKMLPPVDQDFYSGYSHRAFVHGDTVYFVRDDVVWAAPWATPGQLRGPF